MLNGKRLSRKVKGRKRHIVVDTMGNLLAVVVHAANIHDAKAGIFMARKAFERYSSLKGFCADAGYRCRLEQNVQDELGLSAENFVKLGVYSTNIKIYQIINCEYRF